MSGTQDDSDSEQDARWWHDGDWRQIPEGGLVSEEFGRTIAINADEYSELATLVRFGLDEDVDGYLRAIGIDEATIAGEDEDTVLTGEAVELDDYERPLSNGDDQASET